MIADAAKELSPHTLIWVVSPHLQICRVGLDLNPNLCKHLKTLQAPEVPILELAYGVCIYECIIVPNLFQCRWFKA